MIEILVGATLLILATAAIVLIRVLRFELSARYMMALQLLMASALATAALYGTTFELVTESDVAILFALFAAFAGIVIAFFARKPTPRRCTSKEQP